MNVKEIQKYQWFCNSYALNEGDAMNWQSFQSKNNTILILWTVQLRKYLWVFKIHIFASKQYREPCSGKEIQDLMIFAPGVLSQCNINTFVCSETSVYLFLKVYHNSNCVGCIISLHFGWNRRAHLLRSISCMHTTIWSSASELTLNSARCVQL